jgi:hypothetical protein
MSIDRAPSHRVVRSATRTLHYKVKLPELPLMPGA